MDTKTRSNPADLDVTPQNPDKQRRAVVVLNHIIRSVEQKIINISAQQEPALHEYLTAHLWDLQDSLKRVEDSQTNNQLHRSEQEAIETLGECYIEIIQKAIEKTKPQQPTYSDISDLQVLATGMTIATQNLAKLAQPIRPTSETEKAALRHGVFPSAAQAKAKV